jgi:hypothetical protein
MTLPGVDIYDDFWLCQDPEIYPDDRWHLLWGLQAQTMRRQFGLLKLMSSVNQALLFKVPAK